MRPNPPSARPLLPRVLPTLTAALGLLATAAPAQNGSAFQLLTNGMDMVYAGVGAGGQQVPGVDGIGTWFDGESLRGSRQTSLGDYGYRQKGLTESLCVLGNWSPDLALEIPLLLLAECDGRNPNRPDVFTFPTCGTAGPFPLGTSAGFAPYGTPPGASASFLLDRLASIDFFPSWVAAVLPNHGLVPSSNAGQLTLLAAAAVNVPLASTGFCWDLQFSWAPSSLATSADIDGLWHWASSSPAGNQYWGLSTNELNTWQSRTVASDQGMGGLLSFFANVDYALQFQSADPVTVEALAPAASTGSGDFYSTGAGCPLSGSSVNGGFDVGRHVALSLSGTGGVPNPVTGLGHQDPAGAATPGLTPTLGFLTSGHAEPAGLGGWRVTWIQLDLDLTFGVDPEQATSVPLYLGEVRLPIRGPASIPTPFPQPLTLQLLPQFVHQVGVVTPTATCWDLPSGALGGSPPVAGASQHLPLTGLSGTCVSAAIPFGLSFGSSALAGPTGPLVWNPALGAPSLGSRILLID